MRLTNGLSKPAPVDKMGTSSRRQTYVVRARSSGVDGANPLQRWRPRVPVAVSNSFKGMR